MRVFSDNIGHSDLYHSLYLLFEKRLGGELYFPIRKGWSNFLKLNPPVICSKSKSFPSLDDKKKKTIYWGVECEKHEIIDGIHYYYRKMEPNKGYYIQKKISFKKFLEMDFDIILTVYKGHEELFYNLVKKYKPNAIFIRQIGNIGERPLGYCKNILHAVGHEKPAWASKVNYIKYCPENYEGYHYTPPINHNTITSFMNYLPSYPREMNLWNQLKSSLPNFTFKMHGAGGDDGWLQHLLVPQAMRTSAFIWHVKPHGSGGFIPRQALSCGRPLIIRKKYCKQFNIILLDFIQNEINCIDLDAGRGLNLIREWSEPDKHKKICKNIAEKFQRDANFAGKAEQIKNFLANAKKGV